MTATRLTAEAAVARIPDGATVGVSGLGLCGWAEEVGVALEQAYLEGGHPRDLTLVHGAGIGNALGAGTHHLGHEGLVTKWIGAHTGVAPAMAQLIEENHCAAYCIPQGVVVQLYREIAAHRPGIISKVGLGTYVDPRVEGAKMNEATTEEYVKVVEIEGEEYLFYPSFPIDVAVIRATTADERGNLAMDEEALLLEQLPLAQAAKNTGGIVIAQVKYEARGGSLHPKHARIPGALVDYVVVASSPEYHPQTAAADFEPALAGDLKIPLAAIPPLPMSERLVVARRASAELFAGAVVNTGFGYPDGIGSVCAQEGVADLVTLTTEVGAIGGEPGVDFRFGTSYNADVFLEHQATFDWYDGGGIDIAFLGLAQTDRWGNVNVSRFSGRAVGVGGFVNISQGTRNIVYCGGFTAGGLKVETGDGQLRIITEGAHKKFLDQVEEITFSGTQAAARGQRVLYVTERAVFELRDGRMTLVEIAPGVDLENDVLAQMEFEPTVADDLDLMDAALFRPQWGGLRSLVEGRAAAGSTPALHRREGR